DDAAKQCERAVYDLLFVELPAVDPAPVMALAARSTPALPVVGLADDPDDELWARALTAGLRDLVRPERNAHVASVAKRELAALTAMRAVSAAHGHAEVAREERDALFLHSGDALAHTEDG